MVRLTALPPMLSIRIEADCVALFCQYAEKLKRATTLEFTNISAIIFIHCVCPACTAVHTCVRFFTNRKYTNISETAKKHAGVHSRSRRCKSSAGGISALTASKPRFLRMQKCSGSPRGVQ